MEFVSKKRGPVSADVPPLCFLETSLMAKDVDFALYKLASSGSLELDFQIS